MKSFFKKIINWILNIIIVLIFICLIFSAYNFVSLNILNKSYTNYFGYTYFQILTGSMENEIMVDDFVFVDITKDVKVDDVISFVVDDQVITHRVGEIDDDVIITKGDANNAEDAPINYDQVIGKVVYIGRDYGKYLKVITEPIVMISFFLTIILFNIALASDKKERSAEDEKEIKTE